MNKPTIIIYHKYIPKVGGIESVLLYLVKLLDKNGYKVIVAYEAYESYESLFRLSEYADVVSVLKFKELVCDVLLIASNFIYPHNIRFKKSYQWIHSDYDKYGLDLAGNNVDGYIAVSEHCAKVAKRRFGIECKVIYNVLDDDYNKYKKPEFFLVTNTRISREKGFASKRMLKFAQGLKNNGIAFKWVVYGDNSHFPQEFEQYKNEFKDIEEVQWVGYKKDIRVGLIDADYFVMMSDFEGCPLAVLEALSFKVPCILSNYLGADELIRNGENGYLFDLNPEKWTAKDFLRLRKKPVIEKYEPLATIKDWEEVFKI